MPKNIYILFLFVITLLASCQKDTIVLADPDIDVEEISEGTDIEGNSMHRSPYPNIVTGYNMRWRDTPDFGTSNVLTLVDSLRTEIFRYPGGTMAHDWDWQNGLPYTWPQNATPHPIEDVKTLADATGAKVTFVLDIINRTLEDQINMLNAANVPVEFIELGNELYSQDYVDVFPDGAAYADTINAWVPGLRSAFPNAKIGAVMIGRYVGPGNMHNHTWNDSVYQNITQPIDAHIYHVYISNTINNGAGETAQERIDRMDQVFINDPNVEVWITEYGDKGQNYFKTFELADLLVEHYSPTLLVNHCFMAKSGSFTKIEESAPGSNNYIYTNEGLDFLALYNNKVGRGTQSYTEDFEANLSLTELGYQSFALPNQTIGDGKVVKVNINPGKYADKNNVSLSSDQGLNIYYDNRPDNSGTMDNVWMSPLFPSTNGADTINLDIAYMYRTQNKGKVTVYWSDTHDGSADFDESQWTPLGAEITAQLLFNEGFGDNEYKRFQFVVAPDSAFRVAVRIEQNFTRSKYRTRWRFDNLKVQ